MSKTAISFRIIPSFRGNWMYVPAYLQCLNIYCDIIDLLPRYKTGEQRFIKALNCQGFAIHIYLLIICVTDLPMLTA